MSNTNAIMGGTDEILVVHQRAITYAAFSATGQTITSLVSIDSSIDSAVRAAARHHLFDIVVYLCCLCTSSIHIRSQYIL